MIRWSESICAWRLSEIWRSTPSWKWSYSSGAPPVSSFLRVMSPASDVSSVVSSFFPSVCSLRRAGRVGRMREHGNRQKKDEGASHVEVDSGPLCPGARTGLRASGQAIDRVEKFFGVAAGIILNLLTGGQPGPPLGRPPAPHEVRNESPSAHLDLRRAGGSSLHRRARARAGARSPWTVELLGLWSEQGVPLQVVARGLLRAAERARWNGAAGAAPRSLRACRPEVDAEIEAWKLRSLGARAGRTGRWCLKPVGFLWAACAHRSVDRAERLHTAALEMVQEPAPRSRTLRGTSPRTWGRRD